MLNKLQSTTKGRHVITSVGVILSSILMAFATQTFIRPMGILPAGFMGLATLLSKILDLYAIDFPVYIGLIALNLPVAILCIKGISFRFTFYSMLQVMLTSFLLKAFNFSPIFDDTMLNLIFGGVIWGFSIILALRGDTSTGGTDFIALYVSNKTGNSIWYQVFLGNVLLLGIYGAIFGWEYAGISILFQYISTKTISTFHQRYNRVTLIITTKKKDKVLEAYFKNFHHGISCIEAIGGYSNEKVYVLHAVVSAYEQQKVIGVLSKADPNIIINIIKTTNFIGRFRNVPIE